MKRPWLLRLTVLAGAALVIAIAAALLLNSPGAQRRPAGGFDDMIARNAERMLDEGQSIFRYDTFGDESFWGGQLRLHDAIAGAANGGVGPGVSPRQALALGLKVDSDALPADIRQAIVQGRVNLDDPATTLTLLRLNAVVGVTGFFNGDRMASIGIQCALCHSTVTNDLQGMPGIGRRLDGWANQDLNVGAIIASAPDLTPLSRLLGVDVQGVRNVLLSWGPGKFDAQLILDGRAFQPDGRSSATLIPPAFGLAGQNLHTSTGFGAVPYWNAFVAGLEMHGHGMYWDPRLGDPNQFPVAARAGFARVEGDPDLITSKLPALQFYQLAIPAPRPSAGTFDRAAADRGEMLFNGRARCGECHVDPLYSEPGYDIHTPQDIGIDGFQASRSPAHGYRTTPLAGIWTHTQRGFFHDGRFPTLIDVVDHFDSQLSLGLSDRDKQDVVQYMLSLPRPAEPLVYTRIAPPSQIAPAGQRTQPSYGFQRPTRGRRSK